ncbi:unnamed protein product [Caenorhabditis brenneri]
MGMPILRLPLVVQRKLVPMFDTRDVIDLSFKCKAFRRMMMSSKLPCKSLKWFFKRNRPGITIGYGYSKLKIRLHMRRRGEGDAFSNCGEVGSKTIAPSQCRLIRYDLVGRRMGCRRYNMWLKNNRGVHPIDIMATYTSVLLDIFSPEEFRVTWGLKNLEEFFKLFVWKITKKFSIVKFRTDEDSNPHEIPNAVFFLNDQIETTEKMIFNIKKEENLPSIQLTLKQKRMKIVDSPCFDFETFLKMESHSLELKRNGLLNLGDLRKMIHAWIAGSLPNLEYFIAEGFYRAGIEIAQVTEGIETFKVTDKPAYEVFHHYTWNENAVEIVRDFDKRKASIFLNNDKFAFIIWTSDGVLWKRDDHDSEEEEEEENYDTVELVEHWNSGDEDDN